MFLNNKKFLNLFNFVHLYECVENIIFNIKEKFSTVSVFTEYTYLLLAFGDGGTSGDKMQD